MALKTVQGNLTSDTTNAEDSSLAYLKGTASYRDPTSDPDPSSLQDVKEDICPKGWRLPTSTNDGEFQTLYTAYSSGYTAFQTALDTPLSGDFFSGTARHQGKYGRFWSSTWYSTYGMSYLIVDSSNVSPSNNYGRVFGISARCILGS